MGAANMLNDGTLLSLIAHHLYGGCPKGSPNLSDCQVPTHGKKIPLVRKLKNQKNLTLLKTISYISGSENSAQYGEVRRLFGFLFFIKGNKNCTFL